MRCSQPGWLPALLGAAAAAGRGVAALQGVNLQVGMPLGRARVDGWGIGWNRWWQAVQLGRDGAPPGPQAAPRQLFGASATAVLLDRTALARVARDGEVFDPRLDTYYEDVDLAGRLLAAGFTALCVPAARAAHAGSDSAAALGARAGRCSSAIACLVLARLLGCDFPRALPRALARDLLDLGRHPGRLAPTLAGWRRARRLLPAFRHQAAPVLPRSVLLAGAS